MGGSILGFGYTFSYDHQLLGWFEYAMVAASEFIGGAVCGRASSIRSRGTERGFSSTVIQQMPSDFFVRLAAVSKKKHRCNYPVRKYSIFEVPLGRLARDLLAVILIIVIVVLTYFPAPLEIALTFYLLFGLWVANVVSSGSFVSESDSRSFIPEYQVIVKKEDGLETPRLHTDTWKQ